MFEISFLSRMYLRDKLKNRRDSISEKKHKLRISISTLVSCKNNQCMRQLVARVPNLGETQINTNHVEAITNTTYHLFQQL